MPCPLPPRGWLPPTPGSKASRRGRGDCARMPLRTTRLAGGGCLGTPQSPTAGLWPRRRSERRGESPGRCAGNRGRLGWIGRRVWQRPRIRARNFQHGPWLRHIAAHAATSRVELDRRRQQAQTLRAGHQAASVFACAGTITTPRKAAGLMSGLGSTSKPLACWHACCPVRDMCTGRPARLKSFSYVGIHRYSLTFCTDWKATIISWIPTQ